MFCKLIHTQLQLAWADRLYLALGCARGLTALHAFSPDLCHRDVKSFNFLVDHQFNAKIADLELGVASDIIRRSSLDYQSKINTNLFSKLLPFSVGSSSIDDVETGQVKSNEKVLQPDEFLANWLAPEVIKTGKHRQASDIYSFVLVLWEILSGKQPYEDIRKQDDIRDLVVSGIRPEFPSWCLSLDSDKDANENGNMKNSDVSNGVVNISEELKRDLRHYTALIVRGWQHEIFARPSAHEIESELDCMWKGVCNSLVVDTDIVPNILEFLSKAPGINVTYQRDLSYSK